jgi:hypothetical protein
VGTTYKVIDPTSQLSLAELGFKDGSSVYVDWTLEGAHEWFGEKVIESVALHPSVRKFREANQKPLTIYDCLDQFQVQERLGPNDTWSV